MASMVAEKWVNSSTKSAICSFRPTEGELELQLNGCRLVSKDVASCGFYGERLTLTATKR
jgi:hypothetical protein